MSAVSLLRFVSSAQVRAKARPCKCAAKTCHSPLHVIAQNTVAHVKDAHALVAVGTWPVRAG